MQKRILSASICDGKGKPCVALSFHCGINILSGQETEEILPALAHIFGGRPCRIVQAVMQWDTDDVLFVSAVGGACSVEKVMQSCKDPARLVKAFHKQRFLNFRNCSHILDGADVSDGFLDASDLLQEKLRDALSIKDDRPLFLYNFLERLDEAVDLRPIFDALNATGRQVFIAVPHYYQIKALDETSCDTAIYAL